jgi:hypothetical protein
MDFFSYISTVIMRDMRDKLMNVGLVILLIGIVAVIPYLIKVFFWILLQMMYYPLTTMIILANLLLWNYLYCVYTEKTEKK